MEVSIPNCIGAHRQTARRQLPWIWQQKIYSKTAPLLIMWTKPFRVLLLQSQRLRALLLRNPCLVIQSRDIHFPWGRRWRYRYRTVRELITRMQFGNYPEDGCQNVVDNRSFLIIKPDRPVYYFFSPEFGCYCPFVDYQTARRNHTDDCSIFSSRKPILFDNIVMHLLHFGLTAT